MLNLQLPAFGETQYFDHQENRMARVVLIENAAPTAFADYCALLQKEGFVCQETADMGHRAFAALEKDGWGVFVNHFQNTAQLQLVVEENTQYFSYRDCPGEACATPQLTQVHLSDYGLSDVVRLSDGRLIIIDGANVFEKDVDNLFARLQKDSPAEKPVIAAWIYTHPHSDHYFCFFPFMEKYGDQVEIQRFFFNFPEGDDLTHYPKLAKDGARYAQWKGIESITGSEILQQFREDVKKLGVPVYTPHTGQTYAIGDSIVQFFGTMDDTIHRSQNINATSLMFMMALGGQRIFFGGDGSFSDAALAERYGEELKCDILQVPHHGFGCGTEEGQIAGYRLMAPEVCLLPVEKHLAYQSFTTYREGTNYLFTRMHLKEMITGEKEQVLPLPYTADPAGVFSLQQNYLRGRDDAGARTWVFSDLNTGNPADFMFSVLNTTYLNADITVELYFEGMQKKTLRVQNKGLRLGVFRLNCLLTPEEDQSLFDAPDFLESRGIPKNTWFSVRFTSNLPVVISHRNHLPAYRSTIV